MVSLNRLNSKVECRLVVGIDQIRSSDDLPLPYFWAVDALAYTMSA